MVYPSLTIQSLIDRCDKDITEFKTLQKINRKTDIYTLYIPKDDRLDTLKENTKDLMNDLTIGNYIDYISTKSLHEQQILWIKRTYLLYQLLIFTNYFCLQKNEYNILCNNGQFKYPYLHITNDDLLNIDIGIFGSKTPTSDIDIGFEYYGPKSMLYYIVSIFENLFFIFTGKSSLKFDIEAYGNLLVLRNKRTSKYSTYFYLDTSVFTLYQYHNILYLAGASIWRNILLHDINHKTTFHNILETIKKYIDIDINIFQLKDNNWFIKARHISRTYVKMLNMNEKKANIIYCNKLKKAEDCQKKILQKYNYYYKNKNIELKSSEIFNITKELGDSFIYKQENYICSSSVIHIVRLLQQKKDELQKYDTLTPGTYCNKRIQHLDPYCTIGRYGYLLSILEQIGYLYRFHMTYINKPDLLHKKTTKYTDRIRDGLMRIDQISQNIQRNKTYKHRIYKNNTHRVKRKNVV